jgi:hypothetical protein
MQTTWWISSSLSSGFPLTMSLCYTDSEAAGLDENNLEMFRWSNGAWVAQGAIPDPAHNCVTLAGITDFSVWTLADTSNGQMPTMVIVRNLTVRPAGGHGILTYGFVLVLGIVAILCNRCLSKR